MPIKIYFEDTFQGISVIVMLTLLCYYISHSVFVGVIFACLFIYLFIALKKRNIIFGEENVEINSKMWGKIKYNLSYKEIERVIITGSGATTLISGNVKVIFFKEKERKFSFSFYAYDKGKIMAMIKLLNSKSIEVDTTIVPLDDIID